MVKAIGGRDPDIAGNLGVDFNRVDSIVGKTY
jgi:hypothetical protein